MIAVTYASIDRVRKTRKFKTLKGAQNYARYWVGPHPELGGSYAVSFDGVGKITCAGCTLRELFPQSGPSDAELEAAAEAGHAAWLAERHAAELAAAKAEHEALQAAYATKRNPGCTCTDAQLIYVGCDCQH